MSIARFRVYGRIDGVNECTVTIDRETGVIAVRPLRRKRTYELPLAFVAGIIFERIAKAEARLKVEAKRAARKARGR